MRQENGGGDKLASGAARASFRTSNSKVTAEKWAAIWDDYEPESKIRSSDSNAPSTGDVSSDATASVPDATGF